MPDNPPLPFVPDVLRRHPAVVSAAAAATGLIRRISIKPHRSAVRRRELALAAGLPNFHAARCHIFREKGRGSVPTVVIAGFVPDATEVTEFQRDLLKSHGDIHYVNFPRKGFSTELFRAQLIDLIEEINNRGESPVLFSISFGCGLSARFISDTRHENLRIRGLVMISPVLCTADLVRPEGDRKGGVRILESNLRRIFKADAGRPEDVERQMERARRCFQSLFEAGAENRALTGRHLSIRGRIMDVLEKTSNRGGYERVLAMKQFTMPDPGEPIFEGPALALLAETEENMLVPTSPTLAALGDPATSRRLFPNGTVRKVVSHHADDPVAHASLIFHHRFYNPLLRTWYDRLREPRLVSVV